MRTIFRSLVHRRLVRDSLEFPMATQRCGGDLGKQHQLPPNVPPSSVKCYDQSRLPPYEETTRLVKHYFTTVGSLFPYIHEPSFLEPYELMSTPGFSGKVNRIWLGLLNVMLAMATCEGSCSVAASKSLEFYTRAQELCGQQVHQCTTLQTGKSSKGEI